MAKAIQPQITPMKAMMKRPAEIQLINFVIAHSVNFTNILHAAFSYQSVLRSFSLIAIWLCNFLQKNIVANLLVKY